MAEVRAVTYSVDGFRRNLADTLRELRSQLQEAFPDLCESDVEDLQQTFNELACQSNSFHCVSVQGLEGFSDLSHEKEVALFE